MQRLLTPSYVFLFVLTFLCSSCATFNLKDPQIDILEIKPRTGQGLKLGFDISLKISNPNSIALPVSGLSYSAKINGAPLIQGVSNDVQTIPAYGSVIVNLSSDVSILSAPRIILELMQSKNSHFTYAITTNIDLKGLLPGFVIEKSGNFSVND